MTSAQDFARFKAEGRPISMVTAYDAWSARLIARSTVDAMLVGDSAAMVVHGHATTTMADVTMMAAHTRAVTAAAPDTFVIADLPFLACRKGLAPALTAVEMLVKSGAHAVKLEGVTGHEEAIAHTVAAGVPVMGHIGLMPQHVLRPGGFRVQGRTPEAAGALVADAQKLEQLGCFAVVIECVPPEVAARVTEAIRIPTIGIGAGAGTDGQVLVLHDLLGLTTGTPRFVRRYLEGETLITDALNAFDADVKAVRFPTAAETYK